MFSAGIPTHPTVDEVIEEDEIKLEQGSEDPRREEAAIHINCIFRDASVEHPPPCERDFAETPRAALNLCISATDPYTHEQYDKRFRDLAPPQREPNVVENKDAPENDMLQEQHEQASAEELANESICGDELLSLIGPRKEAISIQRCLPISFEGIIQGDLAATDDADLNTDGKRFDIIVCSYALHLAHEREQLPVLAMQLSLIAGYLLIITPHKRPVLTEKMGWKILEKYDCNRTKGVIYQSIF